jgi:hypothetical protein
MVARSWIFAGLVIGTGSAALAQDANFTAAIPDIERMLAAEPLAIVSAEVSRPRARGDITLRADVRFGDAEPLRVKLRKAERGADTFNNVPRYDLAAYELQKFYLDPPEYVVPPTALRMVPLAELRKYSPDAEATFPGTLEALAVVQYWLHDIRVVADVLDPAMFESDPVYARHIGQLNILTYLIRHRDSNAGNFLIGRSSPGARVFSIDHGVAFASTDGDRGMVWKDLRVRKLPADAVARLRAITGDELAARLGVVAQWRRQDGRYVPVPPGANLAPTRGVRRSGDDLQMGLTTAEIGDVDRLRQRLLAKVDAGDIAIF